MMRLFPRFSLRFAWIALTIFLIVFAVVVNYYQRYQAHERIARQLDIYGYHVEEEKQLVLGQLIGKKLTGLVTPSTERNSTVLELLGQLPRPTELERLAIQWLHSMNQESVEELLRHLEQFTNLRELHFDYMVFTKQQFSRLRSLRAMQHLNLSYSSLPPGELRVLEQMPELEVLRLKGAKFPLDEFLQLNLPKLRILDLTEYKIETLKLTAAKWGRFPNLETLIIPNSIVAQVICEPGALRNLKHLDLATSDVACKIDWAQLPETVPQLTSLAIHTSVFTAELIPVLQRMKNLRYICLHPDQVNGASYDGRMETLLYQPEFLADPFTSLSNVKIEVPAKIEAAVTELVKQCPQLVFCQNHYAFAKLVAPRFRNDYPPWDSANWREEQVYDVNNNSGFGGGGFF